MASFRILIVATSQDHMDEGNRRTGLWLEELAVPYYLFKEAGAVVTLASPKGGEVPLDPKSESIITSTSTTKRFQKDPDAIFLLSNSLLLSQQKAEDFDFIFLAGGHGAMWDFPNNPALKMLIEDFNKQDKFIGSVCHGVAGLLSAENKLGQPLVKDRQITGFSNSEEQVWGLTEIVPFLLESELITLGASYSKSHNFTSHIVVDGNLITGQNSASAKEVAKKMLIYQKESPKRVQAVIH